MSATVTIKEVRALGTLLMPVKIVVNGVALSILWNWFVAPLGIERINFAHAIGLWSIGRLFVHGSTTKDRDETASELLGKHIAYLVFPLVLLGIGWLCKGAI